MQILIQKRTLKKEKESPWIVNEQITLKKF